MTAHSLQEQTTPTLHLPAEQPLATAAMRVTIISLWKRGVGVEPAWLLAHKATVDSSVRV